MDKGTQEKVATPRKPLIWDWEGGQFACVECKKMHPFDEYDQEDFIFPNAPNLSLVNIPCADDLSKRHTYKYEEMLFPISTSPDLSEVEKRLTNLEASIAQLTSKEDLTKLKSELKEAFSGFLAEYLSKQPKQADATKKAPYG